MTQNELRNQELGRHEEKVDRNIERQQAVNLQEKVQGIKAANQNSSVRRIVNIIYFLFGVVELLLVIRVILHLVGVNADNGFANFLLMPVLDSVCGRESSFYEFLCRAKSGSRCE